MAIATTISLTSCKTDGCTDPTASNYDESADNDDGSCTINGCTDATATNFNIKATNDDGTCSFERDALIGSYTVNGTIICPVSGNGTLSNLPLVIAESVSGTNKIVVTFAGVTLTCTVSGTTFTVINETIGGFSYTGNGNVVGNTINLTINEYDQSIPETCVYTLNGSRN